MNELLLGLDVGSSSVKASVVDARTGKSIFQVQSPQEEMPMLAVNPGWAEQDPELWWTHVVNCITKCTSNPKINASKIKAIGISYQMHGLVVVGRDHKPLRPSIIWCDSRAVSIGEKALKDLGEKFCLDHFLNSPGNFTASKLRWVKENEPKVFDSIHKAMLPGDYIALKLTGEIVTTDSGLSEGMFWDFKEGKIADHILKNYGFASDLLPKYQSVFSEQGKLRKEQAEVLGLPEDVIISYRAGDQPNNAFSLNVLKPGETAATAGTSGVIYSVTDKNAYDPKSRVNTFIHVNNTPKQTSNGVLLCVNGTGILNSWLRKNMRGVGNSFSYEQMNDLCADAPIGCDGLTVLPFGNGAERMLENKNVQSSINGLNFNRHTQSHIFRAAQEGIVFALKYGFDVLQSMSLQTSVIRAGKANMFLSPLFREAFVNTIGAPLQLFNTDGATGAAIGAGVGAGILGVNDAFKGLDIVQEEIPDAAKSEKYQTAYSNWKKQLDKNL
jgi:xylulokinase